MRARSLIATAPRLAAFLVVSLVSLPAALLAPVALAEEPADLPKGILALSPYPAPPLEVVDIDGAPYALAQDRGAWVFVHFWASWCGPCRKEMPSIQAMFQTLEAEGLRLALVNTAEGEDTVFEFLAAHAPELRPLLDRDGQTTEAWRPRGLPATYLVDPQGRVRYQVLGGSPWDTPPYLAFLRGLLGSPSP